jgi:hypothetical protein
MLLEWLLAFAMVNLLHSVLVLVRAMVMGRVQVIVWVMGQATESVQMSKL